MAEPSIRESIAAATKQLSAEPAESALAEVAPEHAPEAPPESPEESPVEASPEPAQRHVERLRGPDGKFAKAQPQVATTGPTDAPEADAQAQPAAPPPAPKVKPPASWTAAAREAWEKLPPVAQAEVDRREREVSQLLAQSAQHRKAAEALDRTIAPYRAIMGPEPIRFLESTLQTVAALRTGNRATKASILAQLAISEGVDGNALADALEGKAPAQGQEAPQEFRDPRVDAMLRNAQEVGQRQQAEATARAHREMADLEASGEAEHLAKVGQEMLLVAQAAFQRGETPTIKQIYERACLLHPEVRPLVEQRKAAHAVANARASTQRARAASSSVRHEPTAPSNGAEPKSLREHIRAAAASVRPR